MSSTNTITNPEIEKVLIGACLRYPENVSVILDSLSAKDFSSPQNRNIFDAVRSLSTKGSPIEPLSVSNELRAHGKEISLSQLVEIEDQFFDGMDVNYYVRQLKSLSIKRRVQETLPAIVKRIDSDSLELSELGQIIDEEVVSIIRQPGLPRDLKLPTFAEIAVLNIKITWLVDHLIPERAIILLHAKGGAYKTWIALQLGSCVSEGKPFAGLVTIRTPVTYIDFENPFSILPQRARILNISEMRLWHHALNSLPPLPKLDSDEWVVLKHLPQGLLIFDTLRASHLLDENSSRDMAFILDRLKILRELGFTIILLHHAPKSDERTYKGSTAISDLCDHVLTLERVREIGSDEIIEDEQELDLPFRFGVRGKTRFEPFTMFLRFDSGKGFVRADDPDISLMSDMARVLEQFKTDYPNQSTFYKKCRDDLSMKKGQFSRLTKKGEGKFWAWKTEKNNAKVYVPISVQKTEEKFNTQNKETTGFSGLPEDTQKTEQPSLGFRFSGFPTLYKGGKPKNQPMETEKPDQADYDDQGISQEQINSFSLEESKGEIGDDEDKF
jgi:hypothetical protein